MIGGIAYVVLQDQAAAREVVVEALAAAVRDEWPVDEATARRRALAVAARLLRRRAARRGGVDPDLPSSLPVAEPALDAFTPAETHAALAALSPRARVLLALHAVADLEGSELAEAVGRPRMRLSGELATAYASLDAAARRSSSSPGELEEIDGP